jgi:hypothetical protein
VTVLGVFLLLLAAGFVGVGVRLLLRRTGDRRLLRRLTSAARPELGRLSGSLPRSVLVTGLTAPGPEGVLVAPAYRTDCVWYRTEVISDAGDTPRLHLRREGGGDFLVLMDGTGSVRIPAGSTEPMGLLSESLTLTKGQKPAPGTGLARLDQAGLVPADTYPWLGLRTLDVRETTVGIGVPVSVLGRPRTTSGGVVIGRAAVSSQTPEDWIRRLEQGIAGAGQSAVALPLIGLALAALAVVMLWPS